MKKGIFITFEGSEGSGKTLQSNLLVDHLKKMGYSTIYTREPGGTIISEKIRKILLNSQNKIDIKTELLLYLSSRSELISKIINPSLLKNQFIICDRYTDASLAYQGYGRGLDINLIKTLNDFSTNKIKPDITFLLDISPKIGIKRTLEKHKGKLDRIEQENLSFHQKVRKGYLSIAKQEPKRIKIIKQDTIDNMQKKNYKTSIGFDYLNTRAPDTRTPEAGSLE
ncbi:MAG: dTMP kinase [bacterium]